MQKLGRIGVFAVALAVPAMALAGCGGGAKTLTRADLISRADTVCAATFSKLDDLPAPGANTTSNDVVAYSQKKLAIVEPAVTQLSGLVASPADLAVLKLNLIAPMQTEDLTTETFISDMQEAHGNSATEAAAIELFGTEVVDPDQATHDKALADFGFHACSTKDSATSASPSTTTGPTATPTTGPATTTPSTATTPATSPTTSQAPTTTPPFVATAAGFSAVFPATPTTQVLNSLPSIFYEAVTPTEVVTVLYIGGQHPTTTSGAQALFDQTIRAAAAAVNGIISSGPVFTYLGSPAEDGVISTPSGPTTRYRIVLIGQKLYVLSVINSASAPHPAYDELLATFRST